MDDKMPLYSSKIISTFLKLVAERYHYVRAGELLEAADMEGYQVEDEGHWFQQDQVDRFYEALVQATGNVHIAREAGRYSAAPEAIGTMTKYVLGFVGPAKVFELVEKIAGSYTRSSKYQSRRLSRTAIEIVVTPINGVQEKAYQCENRIGYFEAIIRLFNYRAPRIEHPECIFKGADKCRYVISWQASLGAIVKNLRNLAYIIAAGVSIHAWFSSPAIPLRFLVPGLFLLLLLLSILGEHFEHRDLVVTIGQLRESMDTLLDGANDNYNHALMINEIGQAISKQIQIDDILSRVNEVFKKRLDYDRGLILLQNKDKTRLEYRDGFGYREDDIVAMKAASFHLDKEESRGVFVICHKERRPFLVNDIDEISGELSKRSLDFAKKMGSKSFICCPIIFENESLGVVAVDNIRTKRPLIQSDINLLMGIVPEIGISIHNAFLVEERDHQFRSILQTLAASIDARDFLTAGHSERVTRYALAICREMGLPREYTEMIRVASQLHDYGKIGIQDSILKKTSSLTDIEREEIKTHAAKTESILKRINFEGIYQEVPFIAGSHHEKIDGSGYPRGLNGDAIPLGSRIIAVADFFEAITAKRHYRNPMTHDEAIAALMAETGNHFDPEVVHAFIAFITSEAETPEELAV
ncbi:MAG: phosphohydrolase [Spirochaetes bacterium RIFOXYC1_FULL_54_7]|nr:MAG: phosphohydrolase [Spirochaetes bacterium RIFOXYC1_FULL_54_7]